MEHLEDLLSMDERNKLCTKILSDIDLEGMLILICFEDQILAEINYEKGIDKMEIEIIPPKEVSFQYKYSLEDFLQILDDAKQLAIECYQADQKRKP